VLDCSTYDMSESLFDIVRHQPEYAEFPIVIISDTPEMADASLAKRKRAKSFADPENRSPARKWARALADLLG